jgi:drug/metabolite transporter (DMT)-like permease
VTLRIFRLFSASFELIFAALLWGFGFIGAVWALRSWDASQLVFLRFFFGAVLGFVIAAFGAQPSRKEFWWLVRASFWPAFWLSGMMIFQTWGLQSTTATKSVFITTLYVVLVPFMETLWRRKALPWALWSFVGLSLFGVFLIIDPSWNDGWNKGDLLTMICAFAGAAQIMAVDRVSASIEKSFLFNCLQSTWGFLLTLPFLYFSKDSLIPAVMPSPLAWAGLITLCVGSTMIAFYLQVKAQKVLSPTVSSLFFLLESPFALVFAFWLLQERLTIRQGVGAVLVLLSALLATVRESRQKKALMRQAEVLS